MSQVNIPIGNVDIRRALLEDIPQCSCRADDESPCGPESGCINRSMMYECHPLVCCAGDRCMNQVFQRRQHPLMEPFNTECRGWGLRTLVDIEEVSLIVSYITSAPSLNITDAASVRRSKLYTREHTNQLDMLSQRVLDNRLTRHTKRSQAKPSTTRGIHVASKKSPGRNQHDWYVPSYTQVC